jgi:AcrR family transcriptional regulator
MTKTDLRERLLQEAIHILAENPDDLTLRAVARAAGVSAMAPYRHFADKAALLGAVKVEGFNRLRDNLLQVDETGGEGAALISQGLIYLDFALTHPALFRLMFAGNVENPIGFVMGGDTAYDVLIRRVAKVAPAERVAEATTAAWALVHGLAMLMLDGRLPRNLEYARRVLGLLVAGLSRGAS